MLELEVTQGKDAYVKGLVIRIANCLFKTKTVTLRSLRLHLLMRNFLQDSLLHLTHPESQQAT